MRAGRNKWIESELYSAHRRRRYDVGAAFMQHFPWVTREVRHTAVKIAGRNRIVTAAIVRIAALSFDVASATILESSAIAFIAALSR